jgi:lysophospholipase L1-like esterase
VYYHTLTTGGTLTLTATGGTPVVVNTQTGTLGVGKATVISAAKNTTNTLTISATGALVNIVGIEPYDSTAIGVRIGNAGRNGATTEDWATDVLNIASIASIKAYAPDLTILSLGINDASFSVTPATFQTNMTTIITAAQVSGDVLLWVPHATSDPGESTIQTYRAVYPDIAAASGCGLIDMHARFGPRSGNATAWWSDTHHLTYLGHLDMADAILAYLRNL